MNYLEKTADFTPYVWSAYAVTAFGLLFMLVTTLLYAAKARRSRLNPPPSKGGE
jgi:heme exporter protein D